MNFRCLRWKSFSVDAGPLKEVSAAVTAASDKAQLDSQHHTPRLQGWHPSLPNSSNHVDTHHYRYRAPAASNLFSPHAACLERGRHSKPESLSRLTELEAGRISRHCKVISIVARRARREHTPVDGTLPQQQRTRRCIQA